MPLDTTDVQMISAKQLENNNLILLQCDFIINSDAQGCLTVLVGEFETITTTLMKNNSENFTSTIVNVTQQLLCYSNVKVFGYDIEFNGSVGTFAVPGEFIWIMDTSCTTEQGKPSIGDLVQTVVL